MRKLGKVEKTGKVKKTEKPEKPDNAIKPTFLKKAGGTSFLHGKLIIA